MDPNRLDIIQEIVCNSINLPTLVTFIPIVDKLIHVDQLFSTWQLLYIFVSYSPTTYNSINLPTLVTVIPIVDKLIHVDQLVSTCQLFYLFDGFSPTPYNSSNLPTLVTVHNC